jgi:predicted MFS family arabinose efflux permease
MIKDLGATSFQIVLLTMVKPVASIFSFYWSERISRKKESLKMNLLGAGLFGRIPFIAALFFDNTWLLIIASALYMLFLRASIPAWMEMIKVNLPGKGVREQLFSVSAALGYGEGILVAIGVGSLLDNHVGLWKIFYLGALVLGIIGIIVQVALPVREMKVKENIEGVAKKPLFRERFIRPWIDCIELMKERSDFRRFQWAFMVGGLGLMIIQPIIPIFFAETLKLSYRDLLIAYSICKGLGFVLTSRLWGKALSKIPVSWFTSFVLVGFGIFPLLIILAEYSSIWLYLAYFVYGIAQAGSHLIWHLSGPIFAGEQHSSRYSGINIVLVGIRGTLGPPLGGLLAICFGPTKVLFISALLCIGGTSAMLFKAPSKLKEIY